MKALRAIAALSITGSLLVVPAAAQAAELGGFTLSAEAAPIALHLYEALIPIPAEPQLELNLSYSRAKFSSGPTGRATSSLVWPGDAVGYGLPELLKNPDASYPVKIDAAHPGGPKDSKQEFLPGTGMSSHADEKGVEASAYVAKPALAALPVPGLPIPPMLIAVEAWSSNAKTTVTGDKATATAYATAGSISLLGGLVKIHGLRSDAEATSDGVKASTTGTVSWGSLTVAGQTFAADQEGIKSPLGTTALPKLPADVAKRMADFGLSLDVPKVDKTLEGTAGKVVGRGLTITLDTAIMKNKLSLGWLLDPFLALLPADLRTQISPWLALAPKFVFILGTATSQATATPAYVADAPPPTEGGSTGGSGLGSGGSGSSGGEAPPVTGGSEQVPVANGRQWPIFPGVPWYLFVIGLALAAGISYGLRQFAGMMLGADGCELGATNGVPNLRER